MYEAHTTYLVRDKDDFPHGWECSCGASEVAAFQNRAMAEANMDRHLREHEREEHDEDMRFLHFPDEPPEEELSMQRMTHDQFGIIKNHLKHHGGITFTGWGGHPTHKTRLWLRKLNDGEHFRWECACGARGHDGSIESEAKRGLEHIMRKHGDWQFWIVSEGEVPHPRDLGPRQRAREESKGVPNDSPDPDARDDAQTHVPRSQARPQTPGENALIERIHDMLSEERWEFFSDAELIDLACVLDENKDLAPTLQKEVLDVCEHRGIGIED